MGKLAAFGALAGLGATVAKLGDEKAKSIAKQQESDIAEARERRIAEFNSKLRIGEQGIQNEFTAGQQTQRLDYEKTMNRERDAAAMDRTVVDADARTATADEDRKTRVSEGSADRKNRVDIANIEADARSKAAGLKEQDRFNIKTEKRKGQSKFNKNGDLVELGADFEVTTVTDKKSGETFEQVEDKFIPQRGAIKQIKDPRTGQMRDNIAGPKNVQRLLEATDPQAVDVFLATYGYLPAAYFRRAK